MMKEFKAIRGLLKNLSQTTSDHRELCQLSTFKRAKVQGSWGVLNAHRLPAGESRKILEGSPGCCRRKQAFASTLLLYILLT